MFVQTADTANLTILFKTIFDETEDSKLLCINISLKKENICDTRKKEGKTFSS